MQIEESAKNFINHSPGFYEDADLSEVDDKHAYIVNEAYKLIQSGEAFNLSNFRNWSAQTDLDAPAQLRLDSLNIHGLARYVYKKFFRYDENKFSLMSLLDDIEVIKSIGGEDILRDNPVHLTLGVNDYYRVEETTTTVRWLRYIYLLKRIIDMDALKNDAIWVDVGSYYGGLQGLVRKYYPGTRMILVDFHHQLCRSYIYLSQLNPELTHIFPDQISSYSNINDLPAFSVMYVPVSEYQHIAEQKVDLATNFFSFGEMRREFFEIYMKSKLFAESEKVYLVNRFVSAPFFEKTYDSDVNIVDYINDNREKEYFDIFPIHHYLLLKRKLFGRNSLRNLSSSYFEMLTRKA